MLPPGGEGGASSGGVCSQGGVCSRGGCFFLGGSAPGGALVETPPGTATAAGGTHPAGMHSCYYIIIPSKSMPMH